MKRSTRLSKVCKTQNINFFTNGYRYYATSQVASGSGSGENDVVVIGGGPGGYVAAIKAAQLGLKTTCIESRGRLGGTCLNVGCIPSKALLNASHIYEETKHYFPEHGIKFTGVELDLGVMMKSKEKAVSGLTSGIELLFKKNGVNYIKGHGTITGPNSIQVTPQDGSSSSQPQTVSAKNIIIATGSSVTELPFLKINESNVVSSTGALDLKEVPKRLAVIGGGIIGLEMGSVWRRLGSEVTIIEFLDHIAGDADSEICKELLRILKKQGMKFKLSTKLASADFSSPTSPVSLSLSSNNKTETLETDVVLVSVGRKPNTTNLGLQSVGIKLDDRGRIEVDDQFRTSVASIRAIGDVIRGPMLAHKAEEDGIACAEWLAGAKGHVDYNIVPSVVYTHPEVAWVGKTEEQLKKEGKVYNVGKFTMKANSRARTNDDSEGFVKFLSDKKTDEVLGVHMIGSAAGELIAEPTLLMAYKGSSEDLARTCHAHPTLSEAVKEAAMSCYDKPIHL